MTTQVPDAIEFDEDARLLIATNRFAGEAVDEPNEAGASAIVAENVDLAFGRRVVAAFIEQDRTRSVASELVR